MVHPRAVAFPLAAVLLLYACTEPTPRIIESSVLATPADARVRADAAPPADAASPADAAHPAAPLESPITECEGLTAELDRVYAAYATAIDQLVEPLPANGEASLPDSLLLSAAGLWIPVPADEYEIRMERTTLGGKESPELTLRGRRFRLTFSRSPWAEPMGDLTPPGSSGATIGRKAAILARQRRVPMLHLLIEAYGKSRADFRCDPKRFDESVKLWLLFGWKAVLGGSDGRIKDLHVHRDVGMPGSLVFRGRLQGLREAKLHMPTPGGVFEYSCVALDDAGEQDCLRLMAHAGWRRPAIRSAVAPRPLQLGFAAARRDRLAARALLLVPKLELSTETRATLTWIAK